MSSSLALCMPPSLICKSQKLPKDTHFPKITNNIETPSSQVGLDAKISKRKLLSYTSLGLGLTIFPNAARAEPESPVASTSNRMTYSRFLRYLDEGAVRKVDLFENGTVAIAEIYNPALDKIQRVRIQLPGLPEELLRRMEEKNVDFAAHPLDINWSPAILDLLGNLAFPLILIGTLLLRTSTNNPAGPNLPFGLGRYELHLLRLLNLWL